MIRFLSKLSDTLYYPLLILVAMTLVIPMEISNAIVVALLGNWLICGNYKQKLKTFSNPLFYLFSVPYLISLIGLCYTSNLPAGIFSLEKQLSLLLFPIIISSSPKLTSKQVSNLLLFYITACLMAIAFTIIYAFYMHSKITYDIELNIFTNEITFVLGLSHVYFALNIALAGIYCIYLYYSESKPLYKLLLIIIFIVIFGYIVLITAKISFISLIIVSLFIKVIFKDVFNYSNLITLIILIIIFSMLWLFIPKVKQRLSETKLKSNSGYTIQRKTTLDCSLELIKENWLIGVGTGDADDELNNCYEHIGIPKLKGLNTHNQYFDFFLTFGIGGLLIFIASLLIPLYLAIKQNQFIYIIFLCHFMICCLTENLLDSNKGIVFYAFFNSVFAFNLLKNKDE